jgi:quercetin dioxygenase-like cupin family protein
MKYEVNYSLGPADSRTFSGEAYAGLLGSAEVDVPVKLYYVRFEQSARTHWHEHQGVQILVVISGRCLYQRAGESVRAAAAGESVRFEAGERHWHGAGDRGPAEHIAINLAIHETNWFEEAVPGATFEQRP